MNIETELSHKEKVELYQLIEKDRLIEMLIEANNVIKTLTPKPKICEYNNITINKHMTPNQKREEFHNELISSLKKYDAEINVEKVMYDYNDEHESMIVKFFYDSNLEKQCGNGSIPDLDLGTWINDNHLF